MGAKLNLAAALVLLLTSGAAVAVAQPTERAPVMAGRPDQGLFTPRDDLDGVQATAAVAQPDDPKVIRRRIVDTDTSALSQMFSNSNSFPDGKAATLNLFPDAVIDVVPDRRSTTPRGSVILEGVPMAPLKGDVIMVNYEGQLTARVFLPGRLFSIHQGLNGGTVIEELKQGITPADGASDAAHSGEGPMLGDPPALAGPQDASINTNVTLLVIYTANAAAATANVVSDIEAAVAQTNRSFVQSGANVQVHLVGTAQANFDDSGCSTAECIDTVRNGINGTGPLSGLQALRRQTGADLVHLIVAGNSNAQFCGFADTPSPATVGSGATTGGWTRVGSCLADITLPHELGHNFGLFHDRYQSRKEDSSPDYLAQTNDNFGFVDRTARVYSMMSYSTECTDNQLTCYQAPVFSNPTKTWPGNISPAGRPTGVAIGGTDPANNARTLNIAKEVVAQWRTGRATLAAPSVNVLKMGRGTGTVTSSPAGVSCGSTCQASFTNNATVTLTAAAAAGSAFVGWVGDCRGDSAAVQVAVNKDVTCSAYFVPAAQAVPQTGWWWNSAHGGRGYSIEVNPSTGNLFFAAYVYENNGTASWYVATMNPVANQTGTYSGGLIRAAGGQTLTGPPASPSFTQIGAISMKFTSTTDGTITWPAETQGGTTTIERYPFVGINPRAPAQGVSYQAGWWYDASAAGTGYFIETQGTTLFMAGYLYRADGTSVWYVANGTMGFSNQFTGNMIEVSNGPTFTNPTKGPVSTSTATSITVDFNANNTSGRITLGSGRTINITRYTGF